MQQLQTFLEKFRAGGPQRKPLVVILGPTASGKTALSLELAKQFNGEIISADSRQVYRYMDIGTDKIPLEKREGIVHHLIDVVNPDERFSVGDFKMEAQTAIDEIHARGKVPFLVGGTGFYIDAVTKNFSLPPFDTAVREALEKEAQMEKLATERKEIGADFKKTLYKKLQALDPAAAAKIHPNNTRYVLRALEIATITGKPREDNAGTPLYECFQIGITRPREKLFARIEMRVDEQLRRGLIDETKKLLSLGYDKNLASMSSLGYREVISHIEGVLTLEQAAELIKKNTRNYAKRQMTWFKRDPTILWQPADL